MATITRNDLAMRLRDKFGLTATDAYKMIDIIFDEIGESLTNGEDVKFSGVGCAISTSSTDIMCNLLRNKTIDEAKKIISNYLSMIDKKPYDEELLGELYLYENVNRQANRINCAKIGINAILKALEKYENKKGK